MAAGGELAGRVVLITGASRGIGAAVAAACARAGASVLLAGRDVQALGAVADAIEARGAAGPLIVPINLETATAADFEQVADLIRERCGRLDGLVLNAAALGELAPLAQADGVSWARVFQVNLHSAFLLLQACLPLLAAAADAAVVFTLAPEGQAARPYWGAYAVSKYALRGLMDLLAAECGDGPIRVHGVVPEPVSTRLRRSAYPALPAAALPGPETAADAFVALLGPRGRRARGRAIAIEGGGFVL
jgi:NAD(P)-dependent dehydrogenase (short-subunit alcohol dehydrogenase family)